MDGFIKNKNMNIYHISDTHGYHEHLETFHNQDIDILIHSGDSTNYYDVERNFHEFERFVDWYGNLPVPIKIYVAGNHDSMLYNMKKDAERRLRDAGIEYLNYDTLTIYHTKIYGYPTTPRFGNWYFMADRSKIKKHVDQIPMDTNILINHGMPKGVLDLVEKADHSLERAGDGALFKMTQKMPDLKLFCGGHIHNNKDIINTGFRIINGVTYSNAAMVRDNSFEKREYDFHGNLINL